MFVEGADAPLLLLALNVLGLAVTLGLSTWLPVGVVVGAVLIRSLLMPALLSLLGPASGWPSRRLRRAGPPAQTQAVSA